MSVKSKDEKTFWERFDESLENQKKLIASTEYIDWLYEFTKRYPKFHDTNWLYEKEKSMPDEDYMQVDILTDFFTAIRNYHDKNLLKANVDGYAAWYNVKYKDAYFAIGILVGQGSSNFVSRYENCEAMIPEYYVDFKAIMEDKSAPGLEQRQLKLKELDKLVKEMKEMGFSKNVIVEYVTKSFGNK